MKSVKVKTILFQLCIQINWFWCCKGAWRFWRIYVHLWDRGVSGESTILLPIMFRAEYCWNTIVPWVWPEKSVFMYFLKWGIKVRFHRQTLCDFDAILGQILIQACERAVFSWPLVTIATFTTTRVVVTFRGANRAGPICRSFYREQSDFSICVLTYRINRTY